MKKILALLLSFMAVCLLCACGEDQSSTSNNSKDDSGGTEEITEGSIIEFDEIVLFDDENITIWLENFFSKEYNWADGPQNQNEKLITFKAKNKTDHELFINADRFYLGEEELDVIMDTGSMDPAPQKVGSYAFLFQHRGTPNNSPLESIEDLYNIDGSFDVMLVFDNPNDNKSYKASVNIQAALNGEVEAYLTDEQIADIVANNEWTRNLPDSDVVATIKFQDDGTGRMSFTDGDFYDLTWEVNNQKIDVVLVINGSDAPGAYELVADKNEYKLVKIDDANYTYTIKE